MIISHKIFNDPVYGFITIPYGILFDLVEHPWFQRLRRIKQVGMTHYVYPGALHTRFHHALGALHLLTQAVDTLRSKGVEISPEEAEAASIAILLHDIGHGPFSHALEHTLVNIPHEALSVLFMEHLDKKFGGKLALALDVFCDRYPRHFLHQLISGQLDMDRMDYLNRDSFYTGVSEGVIGYDRIIKMLTVQDGDLVVEEKGIYSIEKFLIARRIMYWQVYLHKTSLGAEQLLIKALSRARALALRGHELPVSEDLGFFLYNTSSTAELMENQDTLLRHYSALDDVDIMAAMKRFRNYPDPLLSFLARSLLDRRLFRVEVRNQPFDQEMIRDLRGQIMRHFSLTAEEADYLLIQVAETNTAYSTAREEIKVLMKDRRVVPISLISEHNIQDRVIEKYFLCYPKGLSASG